jgi:hypothetical protein
VRICGSYSNAKSFMLCFFKARTPKLLASSQSPQATKCAIERKLPMPMWRIWADFVIAMAPVALIADETSPCAESCRGKSKCLRSLAGMTLAFSLSGSAGCERVCSLRAAVRGCHAQSCWPFKDGSVQFYCHPRTRRNHAACFINVWPRCGNKCALMTCKIARICCMVNKFHTTQMPDVVLICTLVGWKSFIAWKIQSHINNFPET